jgi:pimeloyl-ACP methyl ester carboxylesterase
MPVALDEAGSGEPLVLLHGVGTNREVWRHVVPALAAARRTIAVDLPGFGDSAPAGDGFDLDEVARGVADAVERRSGGGPFDLLGHSLGGAVAVVLARRRPDAVRRLLLLAPAGFAPRARAVAVIAGTVGERYLAVRRAVGRQLIDSALARRVLLWNAVYDGAQISPRDARFMLDASRRARRVRSAVEAVVAHDLRPELAAIRSPLGLLWGERDKVVSTSAMRALAATRPDIVAESIADTGHAPQIERPAEFVRAVGRVFERFDRVTDL